MPAGRPTALTPDLQAAFVAALRRCWYLQTAADVVGIGRSTVYRWLKRGRQEGERPYAEFRYTIKKALAEKEADCLDAIEGAGATHWQALAWILERSHPERWGNVKAELAQLRKRLAELEKALAARRGDNRP
jgi:transposase